MSVISKIQVSVAGKFAVLSQLAAVFALAVLTPAVSADISAHENFVVIWGQIDRGDDAVFKETVTLATRKIYLVSPGGYLDPALRIAVMVRDREYETVVGPPLGSASGRVCASGCAIIWFAGKTRRILPGARIGLHSAATAVGRTRSDSGNAMMIAYLRSLRTVPEWVLSLIEETEPTAMHYINHDEVTRLGLDFRPSLPTWLQPPTKSGTPAWLQDAARFGLDLRPPAEEKPKPTKTSDTGKPTPNLPDWLKDQESQWLKSDKAKKLRER
jgi:hypothetical protein